MSNITLKLIMLEQQLVKTNHLLHLLLTLCTGGLWVVIWLLCAAINQHKNAPTKKAIAALRVALVEEE